MIADSAGAKTTLQIVIQNVNDKELVLESIKFGSFESEEIHNYTIAAGTKAVIYLTSKDNSTLCNPSETKYRIPGRTILFTYDKQGSTRWTQGGDSAVVDLVGLCPKYA